MIPVMINSADKNSWIDSFDPKKRIFTGRSYLLAKRIMDLTLVLFSAPFWLPVLLIIQLVIVLTSPGAPAVFTQLRTGMGGRRFRMYKFRSMVPNAEELKASYAHLNELQWPDFKITNDPRITKVGNILRKTSLDELPQLVNVIKGEMSLVGPRPALPAEVAQYEPWHRQRLEVSPGMTGLWQISGRSHLSFEEGCLLDIYYIENWSLGMDVTILLRTLPHVLLREGAY